MLLPERGGVGWDNNVHVPAHAEARQQALLFPHELKLGWGVVRITSYVQL